MNIKSKQSIISIIAGMGIGLLISIFLGPTCWGPIISVFVAAYFAKVASPKEGAIIGAIVLVPIGIYTLIQTAIQINLKDDIGILATILGSLLGIALVAGIGALYGLIIGKLFQVTKDKKFIF